ncbi:predicted protein [Haematococcus lacustris]|uniref:Uncharacterized protein n=1 Tax=Haematococcus lacustris TaxID=44745 RepID=A0A6A0A249_HAELA|nr:predicted protein [Haematococcus lacustris]
MGFTCWRISPCNSSICACGVLLRTNVGLDVEQIDSTRERRTTFLPRSLLVALGGYYVLHNIHAEAAVHPAVIISLPFATEDFPGLNPINPEHYLKIAKKAYKTLAANNMKVSVKDM